MHLLDTDELNYFREKFENTWVNHTVDKEHMKKVYTTVAKSVLFEEFLKNKFSTLKRFGLEGLETVVAGLEAYVDKSVQLGVKDITLGMPHRGRLNVLANVFRKPISKIIGEIQGKLTNEALTEEFYAGDVKYHLGTYNEREYPDGSRIFMVKLTL
jgi:2-oxoglutarate dehydrogenase E1 component